MADQDNVLPDDKDLYRSAMEPPVAPEQQPAAPPEAAQSPQQQQPSQERDEHGRFRPRAPAQQQPDAPAAATAEPTPSTTPPAEQREDGAGQVPAWRLRELREAREAAEKRAQENERLAAWHQQQNMLMQQRLREMQPQKPPDVFEDPNAFLQHGVRQAVDPVRAQQEEWRDGMSRLMAERDYGRDAVQTAYNALGHAMQTGDLEAWSVWQQTQNPRVVHPYDFVIQWHQRRSITQEIGNDPDGYIKKSLDQWIDNDPEFRKWLFERMQAKTTTTTPDGRPAVDLPPSLNRVGGSGQAKVDLDATDMNDQALFRYAMSSPRRR